jgi:hypothetical protein
VRLFLNLVEKLSSQNEVQQRMILNQLNRIEHLERQYYNQQQLNMDLQKQLAVQRQRTSSSERFNYRMRMILRKHVNNNNKSNMFEEKQTQSDIVVNIADDMDNRPEKQVTTAAG